MIYKLNITVDRTTIHEILSIGRDFDLNKGGYCDARSGCVNFWCGHYDKPECWVNDISQGSLNHQRDYVGGLYWNWVNDKAELYIEITPYAILDNRKKEKVEVTEKEMNQCLEWCINQAKELLRLADIKKEN